MRSFTIQYDQKCIIKYTLYINYKHTRRLHSIVVLKYFGRASKFNCTWGPLKCQNHPLGSPQNTHAWRFYATSWHQKSFLSLQTVHRPSSRGKERGIATGVSNNITEKRRWHCCSPTSIASNWADCVIQSVGGKEEIIKGSLWRAD